MNRLRILWVSHFVPYPPKGGCFQRSYNLIRRVGARHDLHLVALRHKQATHPEAEVARAKDELSSICRSVDIVDLADRTQPVNLAMRGLLGLLAADPLTVSVVRSDDVRERIRRLTAQHRFDVAHLDTIGLAEYLPDVAGIASVMTHHGAEAFMIRRRIPREPNAVKKLFFLAEWFLLDRYERRMCPAVDANVTMSVLDQQILQKAAPDAEFAVVGNGVDVDLFTPVTPSESPAVIFAGRLDQYSNREGILYFLREAWPLIRREFPGALMHVIGMNAPRSLQDLAAADPQIKLHGFVPDVRPYFRAATVALCPVRDGGGTRIKILDALAMGMPIVSTTIGAEGIDVTPEQDILIADTPQDYSRQVARVFRDPVLRARLGANARRLAVERYSWDVLSDQLDAVYRQAVARRRAPTPERV